MDPWFGLSTRFGSAPCWSSSPTIPAWPQLAAAHRGVPSSSPPLSRLGSAPDSSNMPTISVSPWTAALYKGVVPYLSVPFTGAPRRNSDATRATREPRIADVSWSITRATITQIWGRTPDEIRGVSSRSGRHCCRQAQRGSRSQQPIVVGNHRCQIVSEA